MCPPVVTTRKSTRKSPCFTLITVSLSPGTCTFVVAELSVSPWIAMPGPNLTSAATEWRPAMAWPACRSTFVGSGAGEAVPEQARTSAASRSAPARARSLIYTSQAPRTVRAVTERAASRVDQDAGVHHARRVERPLGGAQRVREQVRALLVVPVAVGATDRVVVRDRPA